MTPFEARQMAALAPPRYAPNHWSCSQFWPDQAPCRKSGHVASTAAAADCRSCQAVASRAQSCGRGTGGPSRSRGSSSRRELRATGKFIMAWARDTGTSRTGGWLLDQPYLLLSLTSLFWAGNTVLGRFIVGHVPPMTLAFIRWGGASVILLPFAARHLARDWPVIRKTRRTDDAARAHRLLRLQHDGLLRPAIHDRDQRTAAAVDRAAVCRAVDLRVVRRSSDAAASRRHLCVAHRRPRHHLPRQSRCPARHRLQPRRYMVRGRAPDLWLLRGDAAQAAGRCIRSRSSPSAMGWGALLLLPAVACGDRQRTHHGP